ncbi:MAG: beta-ketoacyl-ACP synthase II [Myxococcota bacterium]|nr:beta-ketoacyl-ACP synthase II [Myxococcota bacterium]MEC9388503.1 beta-ketoacyl-ACP synthase II [Myxococcota bacterium]
MNRVVVTGLGTINPCGNTTNETWDAVCAGRSGIGRIRAFDATDWPVQIAGEVKDWVAADALDRKAVKRMDRFMQFALAASLEAVADAGLDIGEDGLGDRVGVYVGSGIGGLDELVRGAGSVHESGWKGLSPFFIPRVLTNLAAGQVAMKLGARGPSLCVSTACATGNHSIGEAMHAIRRGEADVIVAGGAEASVLPIGIGGFMVMKALSKRNDDPEHASRPFDADRNGFVMGEGAGVVVLESLDHARARGARVYCEVAGYALTNDAFHITQPPKGHSGAVRCMNAALADAGTNPQEVDYINAHGTSTEANDRNESIGIRTVFGDRADALMVSSTKSMTGHLLGAAGGLEAVLMAKAIHHGVVPPTSTLERPGKDCDLDYVPGSARDAEIGVGVSNSFGFGGTNAVLVFRSL